MFDPVRHNVEVAILDENIAEGQSAWTEMRAGCTQYEADMWSRLRGRKYGQCLGKAANMYTNCATRLDRVEPLLRSA